MGDVNHRRTQLTVLLDQFAPGMHPKCCIKVRQRFIKQEHLGIADDGAAKRNALALTAGRRKRLAVEKIGQAECLGGGFDAGLDFDLVDAAPAQTERQIVAHRHVRVQRIGLEHHGDVAAFRRHPVHDRIINAERAGCDRFQARDHSQCRRLAAARRPEQDHEFAIFDAQRDIVDRREADPVVAFGNIFERHDCHVGSLAACFVILVT